MSVRKGGRRGGTYLEFSLVERRGEVLQDEVVEAFSERS